MTVADGSAFIERAPPRLRKQAWDCNHLPALGRKTKKRSSSLPLCEQVESPYPNQFFESGSCMAV